MVEGTYRIEISYPPANDFVIFDRTWDLVDLFADPYPEKRVRIELFFKKKLLQINRFINFICFIILEKKLNKLRKFGIFLLLMNLLDAEA